jgi:hypothetical protein
MGRTPWTAGTSDRTLPLLPPLRPSSTGGRDKKKTLKRNDWFPWPLRQNQRLLSSKRPAHGALGARALLVHNQIQQPAADSIPGLHPAAMIPRSFEKMSSCRVGTSHRVVHGEEWTPTMVDATVGSEQDSSNSQRRRQTGQECGRP